MTISFYKGLTGNPEIGNNSVWVLPNIWRLGQAGNTKFGTKISNIMLPNALKASVSELLRENQQGGQHAGGICLRFTKVWLMNLWEAPYY